MDSILRRTLAILGSIVVMAAASPAASGGAVAAQSCETSYMICASGTDVGDSDFLHDDSCYLDYLACLRQALRFI